jgi:hypothetical protein
MIDLKVRKFYSKTLKKTNRIVKLFTQNLKNTEERVAINLNL